FYPSTSVYAFLKKDYTRELRQLFTEFLVRLMKLIAFDIGVNYSRTSAPPDIWNMRIFIEKLHTIEFEYNSSNMVKLSEVDGTVYNGPTLAAVQHRRPHDCPVNWTEYMLLVAPPATHSYVAQDPLVRVPSTDYTERLNEILKETSPRTITNYVMVQYIMSWLPLLDKKYSNLLNWFSKSVDSSTPTRNRSEACFVKTREYFRVPMLSMYARSRSTKVLKALAEELVVAIADGLKDEIKENEWMDEGFKKAVLAKVNRITWALLDDDLFYNDTALDAMYAALLTPTSLSFLDMLDRFALVEKMQEFMHLMIVIDEEESKAASKRFSVSGYVQSVIYDAERDSFETSSIN
ncbi:hypothetical protein TELCIR_03238, partial [Teladorsagia circumcincta]